MKKLGSIILGVIIGALLTYYFCPRLSEDMHPIVEEVIKPKGVISVPKAIALNDNWTKFRTPILDSITQSQVEKNDNRWAGWSLEDIENYIGFAKAEAKKQKQQITGFRVYFGVYGEDATNNKASLSTVFLVPQVKEGTFKASFFNFLSALGNSKIPPLNDASGGQGRYP